MFCWQLNYDGLDDDDDDQFSSVNCFAIKIYKTRSTKYLKANGRKLMENQRAYKERAPSIKYYYNHDDVMMMMMMMMMIKITISLCGSLTNAHLLLT